NGAPMSDANDGISRRTFGHLLGVAAASVALSRPSHAATPPMPLDTTDDIAGTAGDELCNLTAIDLAERIRRKQISARDVMAAHLARIERVNPKINAVVTLVADRAMADAAKADERQAKGGALGPLHGLPVAHKDLINTAGIRTTFGSPYYKDNIPTTDATI